MSSRVFVLGLVLVAAIGNEQQQLRITAHGWTVTTDNVHSRFTVAHERLGPVLRDVSLGLRSTGPLTKWTAESDGEGHFLIRSSNPPVSWRMELGADALTITSTSDNALLSAMVPAPPTRIPARLLDRTGTPVFWCGNGEVKSTYGAEAPCLPSFVPRRNGDVIYFSLGQVSNLLDHSLFDRVRDIAIDFPLHTRMQRNAADENELAVDIPVEGSAVIRLYPEYFTKTLGLPLYVQFDDTYFPRAPMVWSSWTSYYEAVIEADVVRNTDWLAENLKPYGFQYVELDDGYDRGPEGEHYWSENWDNKKFPHGPQWLASYIKSKGLDAGIWLVPNAYAGDVQQHPEWYLHYKDNGSLVKDYNTPALDATNPHGLDEVKRIMTTLDGWGFDYYKFDGEFALARYIPGVDHSKLYDPKVDPLVNYRKRLQMIRETISPGRFIEGCPAGTPLNGIGFMNSYFTGQDLYANWQGMFPLFSSITGSAFLNHLAAYVMPGEGMELGVQMSEKEASSRRPAVVLDTIREREFPVTGVGTTTAEARTVVSWVALTGVAYPLASVMPELPWERVNLLRQTLPTMPVLPNDLFSRGSDIEWDTFRHTTPDAYAHHYPDILDLKVNAQIRNYDVVALTNWRSQPTSRTIDFTDKLGLSDTDPFVVFDFWNQRLLGIFRSKIDVAIQPHDTRVLLVHSLTDHPQLVGIDRHISGAFSVEKYRWNGSARHLDGISDTIPGEPYKLTLYVPKAYHYLDAIASCGGNAIPVTSTQSADSLIISFPGLCDKVEWQIAFGSDEQANAN
jgi:hypothetical protein